VTRVTRVLVVEDDPTVSEVVGRYLRLAGHEVATVADGVTALARAATDPPDLVILDLMLPGLDGLEVCRRLRARGPVPVIMLTALGEEADRLAGLEIGADDYVSKPFSPRELVLRVASVLRRATGETAVMQWTQLRDDDLVMDLSAHEARLGGEVLPLTAREFDLLAFFLAHPRESFDRGQLLERVWGWSFGDQSTVTVHVRRLREKIEVDPSTPLRIATVWGVGYRYEPVAAGLTEPA
jgi:DNA-binding response OmpR family regulator